MKNIILQEKKNTGEKRRMLKMKKDFQTTRVLEQVLEGRKLSLHRATIIVQGSPKDAKAFALARSSQLSARVYESQIGNVGVVTQ